MIHFTQKTDLKQRKKKNSENLLTFCFETLNAVNSRLGLNWIAESSTRIQEFLISLILYLNTPGRILQ